MWKYSAILEICLSEGSAILPLKIRDNVGCGTPVLRCSVIALMPCRASSSLRTVETVRLDMAAIVLAVFIDGKCYFFYL